MELRSLTTTFTRRWLTGLVVAALVAAGVFLFASRGGKAGQASGPTTTAVQNVVLSPTGRDATDAAAHSQAGTGIVGYLQEDIRTPEVKKEAIAAVGMDDRVDSLVPLMTTSPAPWWGTQMVISGVPRADIEKLMPAWLDAAKRHVTQVQSSMAEPALELVPVGSVIWGESAAAAPVVNPLKAIRWPLAAVLGMIAGLVAMFVHDALDRRVSSSKQLLADAGTSLPTLPSLAVPAGTAALSGQALDSIRRLRAGVLAGAAGVSLVVTPRSAEAAGTVARGLARSLADAGLSTLLVDVGTGREGVPATGDLAGAVATQDGLEVLTLAASDDLADTVAGPALDTFLQNAAETHDQVVIAGGALLDGTTATTLASMAGQTVLVVPDGATEASVRDSLDQLREVRAELLGVTVNRG